MSYINKTARLGKSGSNHDDTGNGKSLSTSKYNASLQKFQAHSTIRFTCCPYCASRAIRYFDEAGINAHVSYGNPHNLHVAMPLEEVHRFMKKNTGFRPYNRKAKDKRAMYLVYRGAV